jgi:hypothetical protein
MSYGCVKLNYMLGAIMEEESPSEILLRESMNENLSYSVTLALLSSWKFAGPKLRLQRGTKRCGFKPNKVRSKSWLKMCEIKRDQSQDSIIVI